MTQELKILNALRIAGSEGINSYTAREELEIIQLPARIFGLKKKGHLIAERHNSDKSVNYILVRESQPTVAPVVRPIEYTFKGGTAYRKEAPRQEALL